MSDIKFTEDHEWIRVADGEGTVGVSDYAQSQLGDVVYVEVPEVGASFAKGDEAGVVESVKSANEVYAPVAGEVVAVNDALADTPELVNQSAEDGGWFYRLKVADPAELDGLMDAAAYQTYVEGLE